MATKQKHRMRHGAAGLLQQAQRSLEKGDFKQALKDAKVAYRQQPGAEARQLLERASLARGRQLYRAGLQAESRAVVESLLELGASDASVREELPELLVALGLFNRVAAVDGANASLEEGSPLYIAAADHAVLRPDKAPASLPAIRQGAEAVRRALAALEADDEAGAMVALKDIARASPLADWKYFVRGLAAYYRQDSAEMQANWDRLDAGRFATKIAASLKVLADPAVVPMDDFHTTDMLTRLGSAVLGGPILARLHTFQGHVTAGRWREAVKLLRAANPLLCQIDAALPQRLTDILYAAIVHKGKPAALRELAAAMAPLPIDPHWNRGLAMAWEYLDDDDDDGDEDGLVEAERCWRAYLDDLAHLECLLPAERTLARALVWLRLGQMLSEASCPMCPTCGVRHEPDEDMQARAIDCLEKALRLSPDLLGAYWALAEAYREWGEPEKAAATWRRLVERFPENLDSLLLLADHHLRRDEPFAAREFVFRAQRLKPLDAKIKAMVWSVHVASARRHAIEGRWEEGRAELAAAEKVEVAREENSRLLVCRAALEFKAGDLGLANRWLDRAKNELGEAAPIGLLMAIESRRYAMAPVIVDEFEHRWTTSLKKARRSAAVGQMCRIMAANFLMKVDYSGRDGHAARLVDFLHDCKRTRWQARDLRAVLEFLIVCGHEDKHRKKTFLSGRDAGGITGLMADLASKARRKFPDNAFFQFVAGEMEMRKGPWTCNRSLARECFQRALQLAQGGNDPDSIETVKRARESLDLLDGTGVLPSHDALPFSPPFADADDDADDEGASGRRGFGGRRKAGGLPKFSRSDFPEEMFAQFVRACRELGLDPDEMLDKAAAGMPFRFRAKDTPSPRTRKRK